MRLINTKTLELEEFTGQKYRLPLYAILSHTWEEGEEVSYQEMRDKNKPTVESLASQIAELMGIQQDSAKFQVTANPVRGVRDKKGWKKIQEASQLAQQHHLDYLWVDTCCIDKSSSAELSEAINSMFVYYRDAQICYAHLADVDDPVGNDFDQDQFKSSRWFSRGWTLQELLAPEDVFFFSLGWGLLGTKQMLHKNVTAATGIREDVLVHRRFDSTSVAQKMCWVSRRETTREEDLAYCMLGIFNVNMPLLYGEGDAAFTRLQEEIMKSSADESIFAWRLNDDDSFGRQETFFTGLLAKSPSLFAKCGDIGSYADRHFHFSDSRSRSKFTPSPYSMTNRGLRIELPVYPDQASPTYLAVLNATLNQGIKSHLLCIRLVQLRNGIYARADPTMLFHLYSDKNADEQSYIQLDYLPIISQSDTSANPNTDPGLLGLNRFEFGKVSTKLLMMEVFVPRVISATPTSAELFRIARLSVNKFDTDKDKQITLTVLPTPLQAAGRWIWNLHLDSSNTLQDDQDSATFQLPIAGLVIRWDTSEQDGPRIKRTESLQTTILLGFSTTSNVTRHLWVVVMPSIDWKPFTGLQELLAPQFQHQITSGTIHEGSGVLNDVGEVRCLNQGEQYKFRLLPSVAVTARKSMSFEEAQASKQHALVRWNFMMTDEQLRVLVNVSID